MAYHTLERPMTVKEAKEHCKYMQPHGVFCDGQRIKENDYDNYIVDYVEVRSGIVHYFTHKATTEEKNLT